MTDPASRLKNGGMFAYTYNPEGNLTTRTRISTAPASDYLTEYTWNHRNQLTKVTFRNNSNQVTSEIQYNYDAAGRHWRRRLDADGYPAGGSPAHTNEFFVYDGVSGQLSMRFNHSAQLTHRYLYSPADDQVIVDEVFNAAGQSAYEAST